MLSIGVDWVALSFVQRPEDIVEIKRLIMDFNPTNAFPPHVMAKIEKPSVSPRFAFSYTMHCNMSKWPTSFPSVLLRRQPRKDCGAVRRHQ